MRDRYPITGIKQSYRATPERRTVVIPVAITLLLFGLIAFFFFGKPEPEAFSEEIASVSEIDSPSLSEQKPVSSALVTSSTPEVSPLLEQQPATVPEALPEEVGTSVIVFTQWMSPLALDSYIRKKNEGFDESFWKRGHWITAVEGRWNEGTHEFRIAYEKIPDPNTWQWQYRANQTPEDFHRNALKLRADGFTMVQSQAFDHPDRQKRFQSVWHKPIQPPLVAEVSSATSQQQAEPSLVEATIKPKTTLSAESAPVEIAPVTPRVIIPMISAREGIRTNSRLPLPETEAPRIRQADPPANFGSRAFNVNRLNFR